MESLKRKRETWSDEEVSAMLEVVKEKHILQLLDSKKKKRNKTIYEEVAKELQAKQINKNGDQIRSKLKWLKCDKSGAQRQTSQHFDLLEEMLSHRPVLTSEGVDTSFADPANCELYMFMEECEELASQTLNLSTTTENATASTTTENATTSTPFQNASASTPSPRSSFKATKKNSYEKVVQAFTTEWKNTQNEILKKIQEQDEKNWDALKEHRIETERILERDRLETARILQSFMPSFQHMTTPYWPTQATHPPLSQPANQPIHPPSSTSFFALSPPPTPPPQNE